MRRIFIIKKCYIVIHFFFLQIHNFTILKDLLLLFFAIFITISIIQLNFKSNKFHCSEFFILKESYVLKLI
jgi:hypothetical protein